MFGEAKLQNLQAWLSQTCDTTQNWPKNEQTKVLCSLHSGAFHGESCRLCLLSQGGPCNVPAYLSDFTGGWGSIPGPSPDYSIPRHNPGFPDDSVNRDQGV